MKRKLLAISSGGGHWVQLLRLQPAFVDCEVVYCTVREGYRSDIGEAPFYVVPDASRWHKWALVRCAWAILKLIVLERPDVVVSTGAAPGLFGIVLGRCLGAKTVWVDSIANGDTLSLSGLQARRFANLWLTQWPHLAEEDGPFYRGNVL